MSTILVTGASSGIGLATAKHLAASGHRVFGTSRRSPEQVAERLGALPFDVVTMDVCDPESVAACVRGVLERGPIDVVVNNAGMGIAGAIEDTSDEEALAQLDTNLLGVHRVCRAVLPAMRARGQGRIVNVGSLAGRITLPFQGFYSASKYALEAYTESLRMELRPFGITATIIEPGDFQTEFTASRQYVLGTGEDSAYESNLRACMAIAEADEQSGRGPEQVARTIARAIRARRPRIRYAVGAPFQVFGVALKRFLPDRWFEAAMRMLYKLG